MIMRVSPAANRRCLEQALGMLDRLTDHAYARRRGDWAPVGAQFRHVLEHYQCFLDGLAGRRIDYDARPRDPCLESSRTAARLATEAVIARLEELEADTSDCSVLVQMQTATTSGDPEWSASSLARELQFLVSHTVHHFALIKLLLADELALDPDFGTAPSTLAHGQARHRESSDAVSPVPMRD